MRTVKLVMKPAHKKGLISIEFIVFPKHYMGCNSCKMSSEHGCIMRIAKTCGKAVYIISQSLHEDIDVCPKIYYNGRK